MIMYQYGLIFKIDPIRGAIIQSDEITQNLIPDYLMSGNYRIFYEEELIPELNNAIQGLPFDEDGGGELAFLKINYPLSTLYTNNGQIYEENIKTTDLKEIVLSWIEFLKSHNLER